MTVTVVRSPRGWTPPPPPPGPAGTLPRFELVFDGGARRAYAATAGELLDALIPAYTDGDDGAQEAARLHYAVRSQVTLQAQLLAGAAAAGCTADELAVLQSSRDEPPAPQTWTAPVPLVLVTTFYAPVGDLPRPRGAADVAEPADLIWLDPTDAYSLLLSLHQAGAVALHEATSPPGPAAGGSGG